jgi:hypothetical protein
MKIKELLKKETYSKITLKYVLFINILVWLSCPIWHNFIFIFDFKNLDGIAKTEDPIACNLKNWFSAEYQLSVEKYLILSNPMSPFFVRVKNQIDFSLFGKLNMKRGVVGKDFYLYEQSYLDAYVGSDYIGDDKLRVYVEKMKFIQDTLQRLHKKFIYLQAPGKSTFYPEFLPDSIQQKATNKTNYNELSILMREYRINVIDLVPFFFKSKDTSKYPLFTHTGVHWSKYASILVMDSINHFIEKDMKIDIPNVHFDEIDVDYARFEDADVENIANLLFTISDMKYGYTNYEFESRENKTTPFVTMIGDSYLGSLYWGNWFQSFDKKSQFWFYNAYTFSLVYKDRMHKYQIDQNEIINKSDIVILGCVDQNTRGTSWGFIDDMYDYYKYGKRVIDDKTRVEFLRMVDSCKMKLTDSEISKAEKYMETQNVSLDSAKTIYSIWKMNQFVF